MTFTNLNLKDINESKLKGHFNIVIERAFKNRNLEDVSKSEV